MLVRDLATFDFIIQVEIIERQLRACWNELSSEEGQLLEERIIMIECQVERTTNGGENAGSQALTRFVMSFETGIQLWRSIAFVELESLSPLTREIYSWSKWQRYRGKDRGGKDIMLTTKGYCTHFCCMTFIRIGAKVDPDERDIVLVLRMVMIDAVITCKYLIHLKGVVWDSNITLLVCISFSNSTQLLSKTSTTLQISGN